MNLKVSQRNTFTHSSRKKRRSYSTSGKRSDRHTLSFLCRRGRPKGIGVQRTFVSHGCPSSWIGSRSGGQILVRDTAGTGCRIAGRGGTRHEQTTGGSLKGSTSSRAVRRGVDFIVIVVLVDYGATVDSRGGFSVSTHVGGEGCDGDV